MRAKPVTTANGLLAAMQMQQLLEKKIAAGLPLANDYAELTNHLLLCVTEVHSRKDLDTLVKEVAACLDA